MGSNEIRNSYLAHHFRIKQETASSKPVKVKKEPAAVQEEPVADVLSSPVSGKVKKEKHIKIEYEESMAALPKVCETSFEGLDM